MSLSLRTRLLLLVVVSALPGFGLALCTAPVTTDGGWPFLLAALVVLLIMAVAWYRGEVVVLRPLRQLTQAAQRLWSGDRGARSGLAAASGEVGALARMFDAMADELLAREVALRHAEARAQALIANVSDIITLLDADGTIRFNSPAVAPLLGYGPADSAGLSVFALIHRDDVDAVRAALTQVLRQPAQSARVEFRLRHADGLWHDFEALAVNGLADPSVGAVVVTSRDITARKALEMQLAHQAHYDALTGLPNRRALTARLVQGLAGDESGLGGGAAVLYIDLDRFKDINDSHGHAIGDALLTRVAERLSTCLDTATLVARVGGDEFVVLLAAVAGVGASAGPALHQAARIQAALMPPVTVEGHPLRVTASIGIAVASAGDGPTSAADLLRDADIALYQAKQAGKDRVVVFDPHQAGRPAGRRAWGREPRPPMATASAAPPAGHATTAPSPPPAQAGTRVRLQIAPLADAEVARWQALLDRLPATGTVQRVLVRDGTATFALTTGSMARLHAQLRQLAETVGAAFAPTDTGALLLHLDAAALPVPTPAA